MPPQRVSADCQPHAEVTIEAPNAVAAIQSQPARGVGEARDSLGDEVTEQLRSQCERDQGCDRSQEYGEVPFPQFEVEMHLLTT